MSDEPRKEQKVKAKALKVKYKSATLEDFIEQYAKDISRTGMWIKTPKPPALGELLKIEIQLRDETPVLKAAGRVVQRREEGEARPDLPPGMGVKFLKIDEGLEVLERIMARRGDSAGPVFESLRPAATSVAPPSGIDARSGDFFGHGPAAPLPAEQDQTVMRQMNALLGEALRAVKIPAQPADAEASKAVGSMKSTMVGMGHAEAAEAVQAARSALAAAEVAKAAVVAKAAPAPEPEAPVAVTPDSRAMIDFGTGEHEVRPVPSDPEDVTPVKPDEIAAAPIAAEAPSSWELPAAPTPETAPIEAAPIETAPIEATPIEAAPIEAAPIETAPIETAPIETAPIETAPTPVAEAAPASVLAPSAAEEKSIGRPLDESVKEAPLSLPPSPAPAPTLMRPPPASPAVDATPKKRSPMMVYAAFGVVLVVGAIAMLVRGSSDSPTEPTPAPVAEPEPGPAAPTAPIPAREPSTPPVMEQPPVAPPVQAVQPPPQTTAEPEPPRPAAPERPVAPVAPPVPAVVPLPSQEPAAAPAVVAPVVDASAPVARPVVRAVVRTAPRHAPVARTAPRPAPVAAPAPVVAPTPADAPAPRPAAPAPRPAAPSSGAVPPNPFE